jgi:hypothetical protein
MRCSMNVVNYILSTAGDKSKGRSKPAQSFTILSKKGWNINCRAVYETRTYGSMRGK